MTNWEKSITEAQGDHLLGLTVGKLLDHIPDAGGKLQAELELRGGIVCVVVLAKGEEAKELVALRIAEEGGGHSG